MNDWDSPGDTAVDLEASDLLELEADASTPVKPPETLPGYELGRRDERAAFFAQWDHLLALQEARGAAKVLQAVREHLAADGCPPDAAEAILQSLAKRAGVKLG